MRLGSAMVLAFALGCVAACEAEADTTAFEFDGFYDIGRSAGYWAGWRFVPEYDVTVVDGGFWDDGADGIPSNIGGDFYNVMFAIVDAEAAQPLYQGTLPYAGTVLDGPTLHNGQFRYAELPEPVELLGGHEYLVVAYGGRGWIMCSPRGATGASGITLSPSQSNVDTTVHNWTYQPWAGANFKFVPSSAPIPEPTTLALLGLGGLGFAMLHKRRRRP